MSYVLHGAMGTSAGDGILAGVTSLLRDRGRSGSRIQPAAQTIGISSGLLDQPTQAFFGITKHTSVVLE